jgi:uncharacterized protein (TIGR00266 family)
LTYRILFRGAFALVEVRLQSGQMIRAKSDAMLSMGQSIDVEGKLEGGILGGLGRMLSGEKFFIQTLTARRGPGSAHLAPAMPGDVNAIHLDGSTTWVVQKDGFLASADGVQVSPKAQNLAQGFLSGEGFFILKAIGRGVLFIESYGAIHPLDVPANEDLIVDNGHLVAWQESLHYTLEKASKSWVSSLTSGEGLVCRFRGPGRVYIQTRNPKGFAHWLLPFLPARRS